VRAAFSLDGGKSWREFAGEPSGSGGAGTVAISADARTVVWTPRRGGSSWTTNWGATWTACAGVPAGTAVIADPVNPDRFYACDARGGQLLASTNGAVGFFALPATFPPAGGGSALCAAPGREGDLWLALRDGGLFHFTGGGAVTAKVSGVESASSLGFGKAAPGRSFPALYLAGRIGGLQALFRSDDSGAAWIRINDDAHQYGSIGHVTGDPRVFSRVYFATGGRGIIYGELPGAK
jgi:photosystem II stability/assembly factor-like uncharacterized protein